MRIARGPLILAIIVSGFFVLGALSTDQLAMLHDPQGWEYMAVFDLNNGMQENHACFVQGAPSDACRGTLKLSKDGTFVQDIYIHGRAVVRHGTYELDGNAITLKDELGTADGPYTLDINPNTESMRMSMNSGGVLIGADLKLVNSSKNKKKKPAADKAQGH